MMFLGIAGCGSYGNGPVSTNNKVIAAPIARASANAITDYVGMAQSGTAASITDPATGRVATIRVIKRYDSAAGNACAEYTIADQDMPGHGGLACEIGDAWQEIRPLVLTSTSTAPAASPP